MRKMLILILLILPLMCVTSLALAAERKAEIHHLRGDITNVDAAAKTFTVKESLKGGKTRELTFTVGQETKVMIRGTAGKLDEIKAGDSVRVAYEKMGTTRHAEQVAVVEAPAKKS
jgi:hypothetical protein